MTFIHQNIRIKLNFRNSEVGYMVCGLETGIMEMSGSLTATLYPRPASSYLTKQPVANSYLSFHQDNPEVITVLDLAQLPAFE